MRAPAPFPDRIDFTAAPSALTEMPLSDCVLATQELIFRLESRPAARVTHDDAGRSLSDASGHRPQQRELTGTRPPGLGCLQELDQQPAAAVKETLMRNLILALLAAGGVAVIGAAPAQAVGTRYPFCMQGQDAPGLSDCKYTSYQQCQATASGRFLYCIENPYYNAGGDADPRGYRGPRVRSVYPSY
jgi:hypothetical protein